MTAIHLAPRFLMAAFGLTVGALAVQGCESDDD
jgi:hypothetical protein